MNGRLMTPADVNSRQLALDIICAAAYAGDVKQIRQIVADFGNDTSVINYNAEFGFTPLLLATLKGHREVINLLLSAPAVDVNALVPNGYFKNSSALYLAAASTDSEILRAIAKHPNVLPNIINARGDCTLKLAAIWCPDALSDLLKIKDIDVNLRDSHGRTTLFTTLLELNAFSNPNKPPAGLEVLLSTPNLEIDAPDNQKWTPLMVAVSRKHVPTVKALLQAGARASYSIRDGLSVADLAAHGDQENPARKAIMELIANAIADEKKSALTHHQTGFFKPLTQVICESTPVMGEDEATRLSC